MGYETERAKHVQGGSWIVEKCGCVWLREFSDFSVQWELQKNIRIAQIMIPSRIGENNSTILSRY